MTFHLSAIGVVLAVCSMLLLQTWSSSERGIASAASPTLDTIQRAVAPKIISADSQIVRDSLKVDTRQEGNRWSFVLSNPGSTAVITKEIVLLSMPLNLPAETRIWGEGFTMLSQTGGTLGKPVDLGGYTDRQHYRIPQPADATTVYGALTLSPPGGSHCLFAFSSCKRFIGSLRIFQDRLEAVIDLENLTVPAGASWPLEEFMFAQGSDRDELLAGLADHIGVHHSPLKWSPIPTGWCSWYCFGPKVTTKQIDANLEAIPKRIAGLRYFQIDDGYQAAMGDWLAVRDGFGGEMADVCRRCRERGFEPAIWVAPFVAEEKSRVFQEHPDWFVKDDAGKPLRSDRVGFGGWRNGPWYVLDGTHPAVAEHLEKVFRTMHRDWGCTYFKLDANYWGAIHSGHHHDPSATRIEAYRRGMQAILRGAGDSFILGCNHPIWPSFGLIHGGRCSDDIAARWQAIRKTAIESFYRGWQHGKLWLNDPDTIMLAGNQPENELYTRATTALATGGLILSGDDLAALPEERLRILRKLLPPTNVAARFEDDDFAVGTIDRPEGRLIAVFNWSDEPAERTVKLAARSRLTDFWTSEDLGIHEGSFKSRLQPHSSRLLNCVPSEK